MTCSGASNTPSVWFTLSSVTVAGLPPLPGVTVPVSPVRVGLRDSDWSGFTVKAVWLSVGWKAAPTKPCVCGARKKPALSRSDTFELR